MHLIDTFEVTFLECNDTVIDDFVLFDVYQFWKQLVFAKAKYTPEIKDLCSSIMIKFFESSCCK